MDSYLQMLERKSKAISEPDRKGRIGESLLPVGISLKHSMLMHLFSLYLCYNFSIV